MTRMSSKLDKIQSVAILLPAGLDGATELGEEITRFLSQINIEVRSGKASDEGFADELRSAGSDLLLALGGDGTMLRAGSIAAPGRIPVLGINLGRLGFMIEVQRSGWKAAMQRILEGDYWIEKRMRLEVVLDRGGDRIGQWQALNECAADRGRSSRPVRLRAEIDGRHLTTYVADGLICATATGSTAYALAAGGPILPPETRNMLLVPVAPHLSMDRAIVLPEDSNVRIAVEEPVDAHLHIDGQVSRPLQGGDQILLSAGDPDVYFVRLQDRGYFFRNLTAQLNSGERRAAPND